MTRDAIGAAFVAVGGLLFGITHLLAYRDPDRNTYTRFLQDYLFQPWWFGYVGASPRRKMLVMGVVGIVLAVFGAVAFMFELH